MPSIIIINKSGEIEQTKIKSSNTCDLYKRAGFKSNEHFYDQCQWDVVIENKKYNIHVYGKKVGKANQENKYDFPPPIDDILFFGSVVVVNMVNNETIGELSKDEWDKVYENLFGGFEDLGDDDSTISEDTEDNETTTLKRTSNGYVKDGFVVSDYEDDIHYKKKKVVNENSESLFPTPAPTPTSIQKPNNENKDDEIEYTSELEEEPYV